MTKPRSLFQELVRLSWPLMIGNFVYTLYNLADTYFLGKLGKAELSGPAIIFNLNIFLLLFGMGLAAAGTTLISQAQGKGELARVNFYLGQTMFVVILLSFPLMVVSLLLAKPLLRLLQTPPDVFTYAWEYMVIIFFGVPFIFTLFAAQAALRGVGDTQTAMIVQGISVILNIALDPILIFGWLGCPRLGVRGAAYATVLAQGIAAMVAFIILIRGKHGLCLTTANLFPEKTAILLLLRIGLPSALGQSFSTISLIVLQGFVNFFGAAVIAAYGIGNRIVNLFSLPAMAISQGTSVLIGQSLGAKNYERAEQVVSVSLKTVLGFLGPTLLLTGMAGGVVTSWFIQDTETIAQGAAMLRILSISYIFYGLFNVVLGILQGAGDTRPLMVLDSLRLWVLRLLGAYLFTMVLRYGAAGLWHSMLWSNVICLAFGLWWLRRGTWKTAINVDTI